MSLTSREAALAFLRDTEAQRLVFASLDIVGPSNVTVHSWNDEMENWWQSRLEAERVYLREHAIAPEGLTDDEIETTSARLRDSGRPPVERAVLLHGCDRCGQPWMLLARVGAELLCATCRKRRG